MPISINLPSYIHIDDPRSPRGYTLLDCRIAGKVGLNPFRSESDEPKYIFQGIRVTDCNGRDITAAVEEWEFARIYEELIQGYDDAQKEAAELRAQNEVDTYLIQNLA